jgi:hypothetical protein
MPLFEFEGVKPEVSPTAWIAPTATLIGDVRVEAEASIWYGAVLRADFGPILVRRGANVQDGSVLHGGTDPVTEVGEGATIGHLCVVHGAVIGRWSRAAPRYRREWSSPMACWPPASRPGSSGRSAAEPSSGWRPTPPSTATWPGGMPSAYAPWTRDGRRVTIARNA